MMTIERLIQSLRKPMFIWTMAMGRGNAGLVARANAEEEIDRLIREYMKYR